MSEDPAKTLFFIKSPNSNITAIELFLKKRGFIVFSDSDLKSAVLEIMRTNPDYIFIAWDHPSEKIINLPKVIMQSMMATIVAYCTSSDKIQTRKLQSSGQKNKLFPPLSGPAIQRLIAKLEKDNAATTESEDKKNAPLQKQKDTDVFEVKSDAKNSELNQFMNSLTENTLKPSEIYIDKGQRAQELRNKQNILKPSNVMYLSPVQDIVSSQENKMSESTKTKFDAKFDEQIKKPIEEMIETFFGGEQSSIKSIELKNETLKVAKFGYCVAIEHKTWTGYLIVASEDAVDTSSLEAILAQWINENLDDNATDQSAVSVGFELSLKEVAFEDFSEKYADYSKAIIVNDKKTIVSFFSLAPELMTLQLHEHHDMIEILTNEVPVSLPVPFDIHLYLPENKKFILYSKKDSLVANIQIDRLKEKKVERLYSSLDFENQVQKFRAENRIHRLIDRYKDLEKNNV